MKNKCLRKMLAVIMMLAFVGTSFANATVAEAAKKPKVKAHAYTVMDANANKILLSSKGKKKIYPASTVKVMTAMVVLDHMKPTDKIKFTKKMRSYVQSASVAHLYLKVGSTYTVDNYLHMMLMCSDADSAVALAIGCSGSIDNFSKEMNKKAKSLGMNSSNFDNPIGLDKGNGYNTYATAQDFTKMARYAMTYPKIRSIVKKNSYKVPKAKKKKAFKIHNTNAFYSSVSYDKKTYQIIGLKTGTTNAAGHVLIAVARDKDGHEAICSFFGNNTATSTYKDIKKLFNYTFKQHANGKTPLKRGYWDVRYRKSESVIVKYTTNGALPVTQDGKFLPKNKATVEEMITFTNSIAGVEWSSDNANGQTVSVKDYSKWFYNAYGDYFEEMDADDIIEKKNLTKVDSDDTIRKQIAALYEAGICDKSIATNVNTKLTKEQVVIMADRLKKWLPKYKEFLNEKKDNADKEETSDPEIDADKTEVDEKK